MDRSQEIFDTMATGVIVSLFETVESKLREAFEGKSDCFLYGVDYYLNETPDTKQALVNRGMDYVESMASTNGWKKQDTLFDGVYEEYLAMLTIFENYVSVGIDTDSVGYKRALFTRNSNLIQELYRTGVLDIDLEKVLKALHGSKQEKAYREGKFIMLRLDPVVTVGNTIRFKGVIPRSSMEIGLGKQFAMIPVPFMHMFSRMVNGIFSNSPFIINEDKSDSVRDVVVTSSPTLLKKIYGVDNEGVISDRVRSFLLRPHYDVVTMSYKVYSLESSIHSTGILQIRPEMVNRISVASMEQIDTSIHNINPNHLLGIFRTRVDNATTEHLDSLGVIDLNSYGTLADKQGALLDFATSINTRDLYYLMKSNPNVFGDIEEGLENREKQLPRALKNFQRDETFYEEGEVTPRYLQSLMDVGAVKISYKTGKSGRVMQVIASNNPSVLKSMLGNDYVKGFESPRSKLYHVRKFLENRQITSREVLEKVAVDYNILDYVDQEMFFKGQVGVDETQYALVEVDVALTKLKEKQESRTVNPNTVYLRNVYAKSPKDFISSVDVRNILSLQYAKA